MTSGVARVEASSKHKISFAIAVVTVVVLSLLTTAVAKRYEMNDVFANSGFSWLLAVKPISNWLEKFSIRRTAADEAGAVQQDFFQPWHELLIIGIVVYMGALQVGGLVGGLSYALFGGGEAALLPLLAAVTLIITLVVTGILGFWIAGRSGGLTGVIILFGSVIVGRILAVLADYMFLNEESAQAIFGQSLDQLRSFSVLGISVLYGVVFALIVGLPLYFLGRRNRHARYIYFLLKQSKVEQQSAIAQLVHAEVYGNSGSPDVSARETASARPGKELPE